MSVTPTPAPEYDEVLKANIAVHRTLASVYEETEPHFRPENVGVVDARLAAVVAETGGGRMLEATDPAVTVSPVRTAGMTPYLGRVIE